MPTLALRKNLEAMLTRGQDSPLLRFSLAGECLKEGDAGSAIEHLDAALLADPDYSAAWKLLGKACTRAGKTERAIHAYQQGIEVAHRRGDRQAAKEMNVFLKRLQRHA